MSASHTGPPRKALRHRIPVRLRHYWKSLTIAGIGFIALIVIFGQARVRPYITSQLTNNDEITNNITGKGNLFASGSHTISLSYNQSEYDDMFSTFQKEGDKDFIRADITIDGTKIDDVGIRLKGNSTLSSLRGTNGQKAGNKGGAGQPGQFPGGNGAGPNQAGNANGGNNTGGNNQTGGNTGNGNGNTANGNTGTNGNTKTGGNTGNGNAGNGNSKTGGTNQTGGNTGGNAAGGQAGGGFGGMSMTSLSKDKPAELPWLISFDEYSSGRAYQGNTEITLRPAALGSSTAINEALALTLTKQAGQTTQAYTVTQVSVNGGKAVPRMLVDPPDESWADNYGDGVLYKGRADGSFDYQGDDPTDYTDAFDQINGKGSYDLEPVMKLLKFVSKSSDKEFGEQLDSYLDVDSFAQYLALQTLLSNSDAMDGPGNNYYLWYNTNTKQFTVLSWDLNLSFSGMSFGGAGQGQPGQTQNGQTQNGQTQNGQTQNGQAQGQNGQAQNGQAQNGQGQNGNNQQGNNQQGNNQQGNNQQGNNQQGNGQLPGNGQVPGNGQGPGNGQFPGGNGKDSKSKGGGMSRGSGALKTRFMANTKFAKLYQLAYTKLYKELYGSGKAESDLTKIVSRAKAAGDTGASAEAEKITQQLKQTSASTQS